MEVTDPLNFKCKIKGLAMTLIYIAVAVSSAIMFFLFFILPALSDQNVKAGTKRSAQAASRLSKTPKIFVEKEKMTS